MSTPTLELRFDGSDGATTTVDSSASPLSVTLENGATLSTDYNYSGGTSLKLVGGDSRASIPADARFNFGSSNFTIKFTVKQSDGVRTVVALQGNNSGDNRNSWGIYFYPTGISFNYSTTGTTLVEIPIACTNDLNVPHTVVIKRDGNTLYFYRDGALVGTAAFNYTIYSSTADLCIGTYGRYTGFGSYNWLGTIDQFEVYNEAANFTGNKHFYYSQGLRFDEGSIVDYSINKSPWTIEGTGVSVSTSSPIIGTHSLVLGGAGHAKTVSTAFNYKMATSHKIVFRFKTTQTGGAGTWPAIISNNDGAFLAGAVSIYSANSTGAVGGISIWDKDFGDSVPLLTGGTGLNDGNPHYVEWSRNGDTHRLIIDGTIVDTRAATYTRVASAQPTTIGAEQTGSGTYSRYFVGTVDDVAFDYNTAGSTANYTPPTFHYLADLIEGVAIVDEDDDTVTATGSNGGVVGVAIVNEDGDTVTATGNTDNVSIVNGVLPALIGYAIAFSAGDAVSGTLPMLTGYAYGGDFARANLPSLTGSAIAQTSAVAIASGTLPQLVFSGQILSTEILRANATLPSLTGFAYTGDTVVGTLPSLTGSGSFTIGATSTIEGNLPSLIGSASSIQIATMSGSGMLPMLIASSNLRAVAILPMLVGRGTIENTVAATYEAYSVNLKHKVDQSPNPVFVNEVSHYPNYAGFEQIVRFGNDYFARTPTGLFKIGGTTDEGEIIVSEIETGFEDLGTRNYKTIRSVYVGGRMDPGYTVSVIYSEDVLAPRSYENTTARDMLPRNGRVIPGTGIRAPYIAYGVSNVYGGKMNIDRVELETFISNQRSL